MIIEAQITVNDDAKISYSILCLKSIHAGLQSAPNLGAHGPRIRGSATKNVSGIIIIIYFFTEQSIHNIVITTEEAVNEVLIRQRIIRHLMNRWNTQDR